MNTDEQKTRSPRRRRKKAGEASASKRQVDYHNLRNPFPPIDIFSVDEIESINEAALKTLEELGMRVLLPKAVDIFRQSGARVDGDMVYIGREMVQAALATAPRSVTGRAAVRERDVLFELGSLVFQPGAGAPHATDLERGRRPGSARDYREYMQLWFSHENLR